MTSYSPLEPLDTPEATGILQGFKKLLEEHRFDLQDVTRLLLTELDRRVEMNSNERRETFLYVPNATLPGLNIAEQLNSKLELHKSKQKTLELFKTCCAYPTNIVAASSGIRDEDIALTLEKIEREFSDTENRPDLQDVGEMEFWRGNRVRVEKITRPVKASWKLFIPTRFDGNLAVEIKQSLEERRTSRRHMLQLAKDVNQVAREKHAYRGEEVKRESGVGDVHYTQTLQALKSYLETSPPIAELAMVRRLWIVAEGQNITLSSDNLYFPSGISSEFLEQHLPRVFFEYRLVREVLALLGESGMSAPTVLADPNISRENYIQGLFNLKEMLVSHPGIDFSRVSNTGISNERVVKTYRNPSINIVLPFDMKSDLLYSALDARFSFYHELDTTKSEVLQRLRAEHAYEGRDAALSRNISEQEFLTALKSFRQALEEDSFDFSEVREIIVNSEKEASLRYKSVSRGNMATQHLALYLPVKIAEDTSLAALVTAEFDLYQAKKGVAALLKSRHRYAGETLPQAFGNLNRSIFTQLLRDMRVSFEKSDTVLDLSKMSSLFIADRETVWVRSYQDESFDLILPSNVHADFLVPLIQIALFTPEEIETEVNLEFKNRNYKGEPLQNYSHFEMEEFDYEKLLEKLLTGMKTANFAVDLTLVGHIWLMGTKGRIRLSSHTDGTYILILPQNLPDGPIHVSFSSLAIPQLTGKVGQLLEQRNLTTTLFISEWSTSEEEVAEALEKLHALLASNLSLQGLEGIERIVLTGERGHLWIFEKTLYLPSDASTEEIAATLK